MSGSERLRSGLLFALAVLTLPSAQAQQPAVAQSAEQESTRSDPKPSPDVTASKVPPKLRPAVALRAMRPWSFTATVGPVALGTALAFEIDDAFNAPLFGLTLITTLAVHAAGNLMNTLFDFTKGVDLSLIHI